MPSTAVGDSAWHSSHLWTVSEYDAVTGWAVLVRRVGDKSERMRAKIG